MAKTPHKVATLTTDPVQHVNGAEKSAVSDLLKAMRAAGIVHKDQRKITSAHYEEFFQLKKMEAAAMAALNMRNDMAVILATRSRMMVYLEARLSDPTTKDTAFASLANTWHKISIAPVGLTLEQLQAIPEELLSDDELELLRTQYQTAGAVA